VHVLIKHLRVSIVKLLFLKQNHFLVAEPINATVDYKFDLFSALHFCF